MKQLLILARLGNAALYIFLILFFLLLPCILIWQNIHDPGLQNGRIPAFVFEHHRAISGKYAGWARERIASGRASELTVNDISGTEWPLFGSVFYLITTEALQDEWEKNRQESGLEPKEYAREAIKQAIALITDTNHATWVIDHWGPNYLTHQDLFYRTLLIAGITSYEKLTGDTTHHTLLSNQVFSLSEEIDRSKYGLLEDYPRECYTVDVLPASAYFQRAAPLLNTNFTAFIEREKRVCSGWILDPLTGLPAYQIDLERGCRVGPSRGTGNSYMLIWTPELWPEKTKELYTAYETYFWQEKYGLAGFREFSTNIITDDFWADVDSGPVIAGFSTAASAFGIAAARACGRFDHAYPMSAEAILAAWPLPNHTWLIPRLLSNCTDAPFIGDQALLFIFSRRPIIEMPATGKPCIPVFVLIFLTTVFIICCYLLIREVIYTAKSCSALNKQKIPVPRLQAACWIVLTVTAIFFLLYSTAWIGLLILLCAHFLPQASRSVKR